MHHRIYHFFGRHHGRPRFRTFRQRIHGRRRDGRPRVRHGPKTGFRRFAAADIGLLDGEAPPRLRNHQGLDERSNGFYVPSPGMVYPGADLPGGNRTRHGRSRWRPQALPHHRGRARSTWPRTAPRPMRCSHNSAASASAWIACAARLDAEETAKNPSAGHERRGSKELHRARRDLKAALCRQMGQLPRGTAAHRRDLEARQPRKSAARCRAINAGAAIKPARLASRSPCKPRRATDWRSRGRSRETLKSGTACGREPCR